MREELRLEAHLGRARDDVARRILDQQQRVGAPGRAGATCSSSASSSACTSAGPTVEPDAVASASTRRAPKDVRHCRRVPRRRSRRVSQRRRVRRVAGDSRAQQRVRGADAGREIRAVAHGTINPSSQRVAIVGQQIDEAHRAARLGAEHRFDVTIVVGIELPFAVHRFEHFRTRQADPRTGQHRQPVGGAREHRRSAEQVADADGDDRNAVGASVEQRCERADSASSAAFASCSRTPPDASSSTIAAGRSRRAWASIDCSAMPCRSPTLPARSSRPARRRASPSRPDGCVPRRCRRRRAEPGRSARYAGSTRRRQELDAIGIGERRDAHPRGCGAQVQRGLRWDAIDHRYGIMPGKNMRRLSGRRHDTR